MVYIGTVPGEKIFWFELRTMAIINLSSSLPLRLILELGRNGA